MHKMFKVTAETFAKNCVHTLKVNKSVLWIKMNDIEKKFRCWGHSWPGWWINERQI